MDIAGIIKQLDTEIGRLQQVKAVLVGTGQGEAEAPKAKRGRPKGSTNKASSVKSPAKKSTRKLSPEGRKKIADAMKRRWAERKKADS